MTESSPAAIPAPAWRVMLIAGPTGVGKSEVALHLAERLRGEIVSVDSMQVYRGLDIGTAKPSPADRARVPHHLLDVVEITEPFDAAQFLQRARQAVAEIQARGRLPILCGGTGLYFKAFLEGLGNAPPANPALRSELYATPVSALLEELSRRDPVTFEHIDRKNPRRIIRAVEVIRLTGRPFSEQRAPWSRGPGSVPGVGAALAFTRSSGDLRRRIDRRVEEMFQGGLVAETERLLNRGLAQNQTACLALGYRQVLEHLRGQRSLTQTVELVKIRTRQFAKRQMTWFQRQLALRWVALEAAESADALAERLAGQLATQPQS